MKVKIYRGTKEIGGTCVELIAANGKILWIDLGAPLDDKNPDISYAKNKVDALLISHPHQDHFGLMEKVGTTIPIYIGEVSLDLINATRLFTTTIPIKGNFKLFKPWKPFVVEKTFTVTPYLTDHSTPECFAFLIEADGKRIFYSGDFRATGRKKKVHEQLLKSPPPNIDLLLMEGTMIDRSNYIYPTELSVEEGIYDIVKTQKNISYVISSAQNIDRFVSVFNACRRSEKKLVIDIYAAWVLDRVAKVSPRMPNIESKEIKIFIDKRQKLKVKDSSFDTFRKRVENEAIGNEVFTDPSGYVYFMRKPHLYFIERLGGKGVVNIIYSQWEGYLKDPNNYLAKLINPLKKDPKFKYTHIHTSGHAVVDDLIKFAKAISPQKIVPIHTAFPVEFKKKFSADGVRDIELWEDGREYQL